MEFNDGSSNIMFIKIKGTEKNVKGNDGLRFLNKKKITNLFYFLSNIKKIFYLIPYYF